MQNVRDTAAGEFDGTQARRPTAARGRESADRVRRKQAALLELMKTDGRHGNKACRSRFVTLTEATARTLAVSRVSVWRLNGSANGLVLDDLYMRSIRTSTPAGWRFKASGLSDVFRRAEASTA